MSLAVTYLVFDGACDGYLAVSYGGLWLAIMYIWIEIYSVGSSNRTLMSFGWVSKVNFDKDSNKCVGFTNFGIQIFEHELSVKFVIGHSSLHHVENKSF